MTGTATTLKQVYNFKGQFNAAALAIIEAAGLTVATERDNESLPPSRIEVSFDMGEPNDQTQVGAQMVYDYFEGCQLKIKICTTRPREQASALPGVTNLHDEFVATIYSVMEERKRPFDPQLAFYQVNKILPRGTQSGIDGRWMEDWTQITFEVWFGIRPSAFYDPNGNILT